MIMYACSLDIIPLLNKTYSDITADQPATTLNNYDLLIDLLYSASLAQTKQAPSRFFSAYKPVVKTWCQYMKLVYPD